MNEKQREAMARLEGWKENSDGRPESNGVIATSWNSFTYDSHDDCQRVIDAEVKKDPNFYAKYSEWLERHICWRDKTLVLCATPAQKVEAILRAKGLWEE